MKLSLPVNADKMYEKVQAIALKLKNKKTGSIPLHDINSLMRPLEESEREPVANILKEYIARTHKKTISVPIFIENVKKAYNMGRFDLVKAINSPAPKQGMPKEPPQSEHKTIKQLIEEQKQKLRLLEDQKVQKRNHYQAPIRPLKSYNTGKTPAKPLPHKVKLTKAFISRKESPPRVKSRAEFVGKVPAKKLQRSKSTGITRAKTKNLPQKEIPVQGQRNVGKNIRRTPSERSSSPQGGIGPCAGETFRNIVKETDTIENKLDVLKMKEDCSEICEQNGMSNSELLSLIEVCDHMDDKVDTVLPQKTKGSNIFDINSSKKLGHLLKHGYTYKYQEKKQYKDNMAICKHLKRSSTSKCKNADDSPDSITLTLSEVSPKCNSVNSIGAKALRQRVFTNSNKNIETELNLGGIRSLYTPGQLSELARLHTLYAAQKRANSNLN